MMGIPFYGRYWAQAQTHKKGYAWTIADIDWLVERTDAATWYDDEKQCARATIVVPAGSDFTTWGGSAIPPDTYDVWYENAQSFKAKLALVGKYGLKGVGTWALGQEPSYVWDNIGAWLNGTKYSDVDDHWAQSYILKLSDEGILQGRAQNLFVPNGTLTRAEAAVVMCRIAGLKPFADTSAAFADSRAHWAGGYIAAAEKAGLVTGITADVFAPNRDVTREEFAVIAERYTNIADAFDSTDSPFSDVSKGDNWSADAIIKLALNNVLGGYDDGTFHPKGQIKRGECAKLIVELRKLPTRFVDGEIIPESDDHIGPR